MKINDIFTAFNPFSSRDNAKLEFISEELKNNKEIVLAAVQQNGLQFVREESRNHRNVVLAAVQSNRSASQFTTENCKDDELPR